MSFQSSAVLKLMDKIEKMVDELNNAINRKLDRDIEIQYEKLKLSTEILKDILPNDFYKSTFRDFKRHLSFVRHFYFEDHKFGWMERNASDLKKRDIPVIRSELYEFAKTHGFETKPCFKIGATCSKVVSLKPKQVFVGMPFRKKFEDVYKHGIIPILEKYRLRPWKADEEPSNIDILCKICEHLQESKYAIMNITDWNANVLFEVGLAYGLGKQVILVKDKESEVPVDLKGMEYRQYESIEDLSRELDRFFSGEDKL